MILFITSFNFYHMFISEILAMLHYSLPFVLIACLFFFQAETTVINQCNQLLSPSAEPNYVMTYLSHSFPQHRQYLCAGAWMLMNGHIEINSANLVCFLIILLVRLLFVYLYMCLCCDLDAGACLKRALTRGSYSKYLYNG